MGTAPRNGRFICWANVFSATLTEDVVFGAVVADEIAHVFDHAEDIHAELLKHAGRASRIILCDFLRRADDDGTAERENLAHRQRHVTRTPAAGRQ